MKKLYFAPIAALMVLAASGLGESYVSKDASTTNLIRVIPITPAGMVAPAPARAGSIRALLSTNYVRDRVGVAQ